MYIPYIYLLFDKISRLFPRILGIPSRSAFVFSCSRYSLFWNPLCNNFSVMRGLRSFCLLFACTYVSFLPRSCLPILTLPAPSAPSATPPPGHCLPLCHGLVLFRAPRLDEHLHIRDPSSMSGEGLKDALLPLGGTSPPPRSCDGLALHSLRGISLIRSSLRQAWVRTAVLTWWNRWTSACLADVTDPVELDLLDLHLPSLSPLHRVPLFNSTARCCWTSIAHNSHCSLPSTIYYNLNLPMCNCGLYDISCTSYLCPNNLMPSFEKI